jgi:hypothetical protein
MGSSSAEGGELACCFPGLWFLVGSDWLRNAYRCHPIRLGYGHWLVQMPPGFFFYAQDAALFAGPLFDGGHVVESCGAAYRLSSGKPSAPYRRKETCMSNGTCRWMGELGELLRPPQDDANHRDKLTLHLLAVKLILPDRRRIWGFLCRGSLDEHRGQANVVACGRQWTKMSAKAGTGEVVEVEVEAKVENFQMKPKRWRDVEASEHAAAGMPNDALGDPGIRWCGVGGLPLPNIVNGPKH